MKKVIGMMLGAMLALSPVPYLLTPAFATGGTLSLSPATGTFNKGCNFTLTINLDTGGAQTDGTDAIVFYDPTRFTAQKINSGTIYSDYPGNNIDPATGRITISGLSSISSAFAGTGTLATVDFKVVEDAPPGTSQIKFDFDPTDKAKTTDSNVVERGTVADILNQVVDGNYTIGTGVCTGATKTSTGTEVNTKKPVGGVEEKPTVVETKESLPVGADFRTTLIIGTAGSLLVILGILGLALL